MIVASQVSSPSPSKAPLLEIQKVEKSFSASVEVLKGASATVSEGESVAILGQSGSGKSTLLALLAGLDQPTSGQILFRGARLSERELARWRGESLGIVFQQYHLMGDLTALENVLLPAEILGRDSDLVRARAISLLTRVGLENRLSHSPRKLSGGECQRVAIARAMLLSPPLILADEPTGNLDEHTAGSIADLFFEVVKSSGSALILVTHSEELARRCDRRFRLHEGRLNPC